MSETHARHLERPDLLLVLEPNLPIVQKKPSNSLLTPWLKKIILGKCHQAELWVCMTRLESVKECANGSSNA